MGVRQVFLLRYPVNTLFFYTCPVTIRVIKLFLFFLQLFSLPQNRWKTAGVLKTRRPFWTGCPLRAKKHSSGTCNTFTWHGPTPGTKSWSRYCRVSEPCPKTLSSSYFFAGLSAKRPSNRSCAAHTPIISRPRHTCRPSSARPRSVIVYSKYACVKSIRIGTKVILYIKTMFKKIIL